MAISFEQAKNYYQYCTLSPERSKLYLSLSLNQELSDFTIDTTEHAFYFAKAIAYGVHHKDPKEDNSVTFIFHLAFVIQKLIKEMHNFHQLDGLDGFYEIVKVVEKEKSLS